MKSSKTFTTTLCIPALFAVTCEIAFAQQPDVCKAKKGHERPAVDYQVQGGLTGGLKNWFIYSDGVVCELSGSASIPLQVGSAPIILQAGVPGVLVPSDRTLNERGKIPKDKVTELVDELERMGFFTLAKGRGCAESNCFQCKSYRITVRRGTQKNTVQTCDLAVKTPQVTNILSKIQQVITHEIR